MSALPKIEQGVKEVRSVLRSMQGKTTVTVVLTADDGTVSKFASHTYSDSIASTYESARKQAWLNLHSLLMEEPA